MNIVRFAILAVVLAASAIGVACGIDATGQLAGVAPDGASLGDGATVPLDAGSDGDAAIAPSGPVLPSYVPPSTLDAQAGALEGVVQIDTSDPPSLDVGSGLDASLPPGVTFVVMAGVADAGADGSVEVAVLSTGTFHVGQGIKVRGSRPLVVVAAGAVAIDATISANAETYKPGPGGFDPGTGPGHGGDANSDVTDDSGGGGAGHLHAGAQGADIGTTAGGTGGAPYDRPLTGGSGGGAGGGAVTCSNGGGAGGGAIQIFSADKIVVSATGGINVGGGGGLGGCGDGSSAGGGGSGGFLLLEAPFIQIAGTLAANGGGGGGGGYGTNLEDGQPGSDGVLGAIAASGGAGAPSRPDEKGGAGGTSAAPVKPTTTGANGGGGGGSAGRIHVRTRQMPASLTGGTVSPGPEIRTDL